MIRFSRIIASTDIYLLSAIAIFCLFTLPFVGTIPYLDGTIDFLQSHDIYTGGLLKYFTMWHSVHPPFKYYILSLVYHVFGFTTTSFALWSVISGVGGIIAFHHVAKNLTGKTSARLSTFLFALCPLYIATSTANLYDYVFVIIMLFAIWFYSEGRIILYVLAASCLVLTKETGFLFALVVFIVEFIDALLFFVKYKKFAVFNLIVTIFPIVIFMLWLLLLEGVGKHTWSEWIFAPTAKQGAFATVIYNITSGHLLNPFAYRQWLQLLVYNFNWVYVGIGVLGITRYLLRKNFHYTNYLRIKTLGILAAFFISYMLFVLSLQTFTIIRYTLPLIPLIMMTSGASLLYITKKNASIKIVIIVFFIGVSLLRLFWSIDPISRLIWGKSLVYHQALYGSNDSWGGSDSITYNMQYLFILRKRSSEITDGIGKGYITSEDCRWLYRDPHNEQRLLAIITGKTTHLLSCLQKPRN